MGDMHETIERLCTCAGMIMEDTMETALMGDGRPLDRRVARLATAGHDIVALADAAAALLRRCDQ